MTKFIELHLKSDYSAVLINIGAISAINYDTDNSATVVNLIGEENGYYIIAESYDEVKQLIQGALR